MPPQLRTLGLCFALVAPLLACADDEGLRVSAAIPASGRAGDIVHIVGEGFTKGELTVAFQGQGARIIARSDARVIVVVPEGLFGMVDLVLKVDGRVSAPLGFWVGDRPVGDGGA